MLYDKKWDKQTKADPFTLASLIAWLETKPPTESYDWHNCGGACLIGQYGTAMGLKGLTHDSDGLCKIFGTDNEGSLSEHYYGVCGAEPCTFGAALQRARELAGR